MFALAHKTEANLAGLQAWEYPSLLPARR